MRVPRKRDGRPKQPITHLWERQKEIARRLLVGDRQIDIARDFEMSPGRMSIICNSPIFKSYLSTLSIRREDRAIDINEKIKEGATTGVGILVNLLSDEEVGKSLKAKIAQDFLDRAGHGKVSTVRAEVTHLLTADRIQELKDRRAEKLATITYTPVIEAELAVG